MDDNTRPTNRNHFFIDVDISSSFSRREGYRDTREKCRNIGLDVRLEKTWTLRRFANWWQQTRVATVTRSLSFRVGDRSRRHWIAHSRNPLITFLIIHTGVIQEVHSFFFFPLYCVVVEKKKLGSWQLEGEKFSHNSAVEANQTLDRVWINAEI